MQIDQVEVNQWLIQQMLAWFMDNLNTIASLQACKSISI